MNYKNPFNNNIQNNFNYNSYFQKETDKDNFQNKEFEIIHNYYESKIKPFNSSKNYISCSTDVIPLNEEISSKLGIPISLSLTPIINSENNIKLPFIDYGTNNIPRCNNPDCNEILSFNIRQGTDGEEMTEYVNNPRIILIKILFPK